MFLFLETPMENPALRELWREFRKQHYCSIERMLCRPSLRSAFLAQARHRLPSHAEEELLWGVLNLRRSSIQTGQGLQAQSDSPPVPLPPDHNGPPHARRQVRQENVGKG
jgi:hypothetical protein